MSFTVTERRRYHGTNDMHMLNKLSSPSYKVDDGTEARQSDHRLKQCLNVDCPWGSLQCSPQIVCLKTMSSASSKPWSVNLGRALSPTLAVSVRSTPVGRACAALQYVLNTFVEQVQIIRSELARVHESRKCWDIP